LDYQIVKKLAAGGFAEVFLAKAEAAEGFSKNVAIKRILPNLTSDQENKESFVKMFLDEARLWARLNHPNIVQVFDLGTGMENNDSFFIVMEFVHGITLETLMKTARKKRYLIPEHYAIFIIMQTLEGLYYAHNRKDDDGVKLNVVHRDISPPNILMTYDGHVKITDFGLAKATTQLEKTNPNSLKGKIDYMSPEQARADDIDGRTDIFATGILLYEMLTNKKLFSNKTTLETLKIVQEGKIPPIRTVNPNISKELEWIVSKALAPNLRNRYQTALDFENDLANYIFKHNLKVITYDLANSLLRAFKKKEEQEAAKISRDTIDELIMNALIRIDSVGNKSAQSLIKKKKILGDTAAPLSIFSEEDEKTSVEPEVEKRKKKKKWGLF